MSEAEDASGKGGNLTAVESISAKLAEVKQLAEQVDARLSVFGVQTQPDPAASPTMSSASSSSTSKAATATTTIVSSKLQPIATGISASTEVTTITTTPLLSSTVSTVQPQAKCVTAIVKESLTSGLVVSTAVPTSGTIFTSVIGVKGDTAVSEGDKVQEKLSGKQIHETEVEVSHDADRNLVERGLKEIASLCTLLFILFCSFLSWLQDIFDKSFDDSLADDSNIEGYVTATECSITPTARSRSDSFVTSPECEDLAAQAIAASDCDTW